MKGWPDTGRTFAQRTRAARRLRGMTQRQTAGAAGISVRTLQRVEAGRRTMPRPATVGGIARALEVASPLLAPGWAIWSRIPSNLQELERAAERLLGPLIIER